MHNKSNLQAESVNATQKKLQTFSFIANRILMRPTDAFQERENWNALLYEMQK